MPCGTHSLKTRRQAGLEEAALPSVAVLVTTYRQGVAALVDADRIPVLHIGQVVGAGAVAAFPLN